METNNVPNTDVSCAHGTQLIDFSSDALSAAANASGKVLDEGGFYRGRLVLISSHNPVDWPLFMDSTPKRSVWADIMADLHCQMAAGDKGAPWEPELPSWNKVCGGKEKPQNTILDDKYKKGKRSHSGKQRRTSW